MGNSMTKEEAREKRCPMVQKAYVEDRCISSDCAVWQWDYKTDSAGSMPESKWRGHCGLIQR